MDFIDILKDIMVDYDLNQSQLAEKIGLKQSQVSEWLKGKSKPGYDSIKAICIASGNDAAVAMAEYISGSEEKFVKLMI